MKDLHITKGKKSFVATKMENNHNICYSDSKKILTNLSSMKGEVMVSPKRGYHSILSIVGNGRFRDRGVSTRLITEILKNKKLVKQLDVKFKIMFDKGAFEPVIQTDSLQSLITNLKSNIKISENKLEGHFEFKGSKIKLTAPEIHSLTNKI